MNAPLFYKLLRDLKHRFGTLFALILVLTIGVGGYTSMAGVYRDLDGARAKYYHQYHLADFTIELTRAPDAVMHRLQRLPNILRLRSRVKKEVMVELPISLNRSNKVILPGVACSLPVPRQNIINNIKLYRGSWFSHTDAHEVILDEQFASHHHLSVGDRIDVRLPDKIYRLLIIGTAYAPEFTFVLPPGGSIAPDPGGYAVMYLPRRFLQEATELKGSFDQLLGMTRDRSKTAIENAMTLLSEKLEPYGVQLKTAQQDQISVKVLHDELVSVEKMTSILPTLFLLVAMLILNVMMNRLVTHQRTIIGTLKAVGYSNLSLMRHYMSYGMFIGIIGGCVGIGLGFLLQHGMLIIYHDYFAIPQLGFNIYPKVLMIGMGISIISAMIGTLSGAFSVMKLMPSDAMRPPAPEIGHHILFERITLLWENFSFQTKMILRAIFRNRFRSSVTLIACILSTMLVFSSLAFLDSINKMVSQSFDAIQHQDYKLTLRDSQGPEIIRKLEIIPQVKKVEAQLDIASKLQHGPYNKLLNVVGLSRNSELFTPVDKFGNRITVESGGLVLDRTLANSLHAHQGDTIIFRPLTGNRTVRKVMINKVIDSYLGMSAYAEQNWLSSLMGGSWLANSVLFKLKPGANHQAFMEQIFQYGQTINLVSLQHARALLLHTLNKFLTIFVIILILFAGVIAIGAIINTAMISLNERERDVASLRVIGYTNFQVAKIFFGESFILNFIGIALGLIAGVFYTHYISKAFSTEVFRMPAVIEAFRLAEAAGIMLVYVLVSQYMVYAVIAKMQWYDILNARE